jgi:hypothetical protein
MCIIHGTKQKNIRLTPWYNIKDIKKRITAMSEFFVRDKIVDPSILSADSTLIKAKGYVWQKTSMNKEVVPRSGIDTEANGDSVIPRNRYVDTHYI